MNLLNKIQKKLSVTQWTIGFFRADISEVIHFQKIPKEITWIPLKKRLDFMADPFISKDAAGNIHLLYEAFSDEKNGSIELKILDQNFKIIKEKTLLKKSTHLSYPFIFKENGKTYIIPESHQENKLSCFEYNIETQTLENERILIQKKSLLDATIFKKDGIYYLFANNGDGIHDNEELHIYYADSLFGEYQPHPNNPIKSNLNGARPAGSIIQTGGKIFRPAQNCKDYYGKSMTLYEITTINKSEFQEKEYCTFSADSFKKYAKGIHTINQVDDIIVIDAMRFLFMPLTKLKYFIKKMIH
jgi:hypothetical protein